MTGHQPLLALRRAGQHPSSVWLTDGFEPAASDWQLYPWRDLPGEYLPAIRVDETDIVDALDLRFVVGLNVHVRGDRGDRRLRRLYAAVVDAKPARAIAVLPTETLIYEAPHG